MEYFIPLSLNTFISPMTISKRIRVIRELRQYTQEAVASDIGLTQSTYSKKVESTNSELDRAFNLLQKIAEVLKVRVEDIIGGFNEQFAFNLVNNKTATGVIINNISDNERKLYQELISTLRSENESLRSMLNDCLKKK